MRLPGLEAIPSSPEGSEGHGRSPHPLLSSAQYSGGAVKSVKGLTAPERLQPYYEKAGRATEHAGSYYKKSKKLLISNEIRSFLTEAGEAPYMARRIGTLAF